MIPVAVAAPARASVLIAQAWIGLLMVDIARLAGFHAVHLWLRRYPRSTRSPRVSERDVVWSVDEACVWYWKRTPCLQRSVVATWMLRRHGFAAQLVIGCRPLPFESHAWVEVDGVVVNDRPQYQRAFHVLDRI